jgi:ubiquinone/menaquinone biosynthesis C-methylase UbiE
MNRIGDANMNPFADPALATGYESWYQGAGRRADQLEKDLLARMLTRFPSASTLLEVGCGSGHFTRWFSEKTLQATGLDISFPMLSEAVRLDSVPYVLGDALALPFANNTFDLTALITTLEFVSGPILVLQEALRVTRRGLILGILNRQSFLGWTLRRAGGPIWEAARFFTPTGIAQLVHRATNHPVEITWRTTLWPLWQGSLPLPWGGFIGMAVQCSGTGGNKR